MGKLWREEEKRVERERERGREGERAEGEKRGKIEERETNTSAIKRGGDKGFAEDGEGDSAGGRVIQFRLLFLWGAEREERERERERERG